MKLLSFLSSGSGLYGMLGVSGGLELAGLVILLLLAGGLLAAYWLWARRDRQRRESPERNTGNGFRQTELKPMMTITSNGSGNMILPAQGINFKKNIPPKLQDFLITTPKRQNSHASHVASQ